MLVDRLPAHVEINVDVKLAGYEEVVVRAIERHDLVARTLVSTMEESSLAVLRDRHPHIALGWSLPRVRRDPLRNPFTAVPAMLVVAYLRTALPSVVANRIQRGEIDAVMVHWRLATPRLASSVRSAGGELYVWTVDDRQRIIELGRMGVSGIITNDPRLFASALAVEARQTPAPGSVVLSERPSSGRGDTGSTS